VTVRSGVVAIVVLLATGAAASPGLGQTSTPLSNAGPTLRELAKQAQDTSLPEQARLELLRVLGAWGTEQVTEPLVALLKDPLPSIREFSARGLGWQGNREAVAPLSERAGAPGETPGVRAAALDSLGKIGEESARPLLLASIKDPDGRVREAALGALTNGPLARSEDRIPLLRQVAADRGVNLLMRCEAIQELAKAHDTGASPLLMRLLEQEPPIPMVMPKPGANQQELMAVRFRQVRDVRAWAAVALGMLDAREALPLLLRSAEASDDYFLRLSAVEALVGWKAPEAVPVLVRRLDDPFADTRVMALMGLGSIGDKSVGDAVLVRLGDPVSRVRAQAVTTLAELGYLRARSEIESLRKVDEDPEVQRAIEAALPRLPR
jgi:HEAT repeat protein